MKPTTLRSATELLAAIRAAGLTVTEYPDMPGLSTTSFSNPYTSACTVICVHFRRPPAGCSGRRSATVRTTVHSKYRPDYTHAGTWAAHYALRVRAEDAASWARAMAARSGALDSAAL